MTSVVVLVGAGSIGQAIARRTRGCPSGAMAGMDGPGRACPAASEVNRRGPVPIEAQEFRSQGHFNGQPSQSKQLHWKSAIARSGEQVEIQARPDQRQAARRLPLVAIGMTIADRSGLTFWTREDENPTTTD